MRVTLLFVLITTLCAQSKPESPTQLKKITIPTVDQATQAAADAYLNNHINPMVVGVLNDATQPSSLRALLKSLFDRIARREIIYDAIAVYRPGQQDGALHVDYRPTAHKPVLYAFVPALKDGERECAEAGFTAKQTATWIATAYSHEEIHLQLGTGPKAKYPLEMRLGQTDPLLAATEEAEATGLTILRVFRPVLQRGGRIPQNWVENSNEFKLVNDNYADPRWIGAFMPIVRATMPR